MSNVLLVARRELAGYFKTPSGYLIAAATLLVQGLLFNTRALGTGARLSSDVLIDFLRDSSGTTTVASVLLAMRLFAEERQSGTLVLLYTSPIREHQIVLGKFLSAFVVFGQLLGSCHQNKMPPEEVMERVFPFLLDFQLALVRHLKPLVEQREHP